MPKKNQEAKLKTVTLEDGNSVSYVKVHPLFDNPGLTLISPYYRTQSSSCTLKAFIEDSDIKVGDIVDNRGGAGKVNNIFTVEDWFITIKIIDIDSILHKGSTLFAISSYPELYIIKTY
jgi:hypothetical protein